LFDKDASAESLRTQIRELFSNNGFKILVIPGNHDSASFGEELYFGEDTEILGEKPFEYKNVKFCGLPFENIQGERLVSRIRSLRDYLKGDKTNILLYHGELLDTFFSRSDFGDEGEARYMPAMLSYFKDLNINYVLAGHFHNRFNVWLIEPDSYFVYPGSPISVTRRETGQRQANLFEVGKNPKPCKLDTPHFEEREIVLDPFSGEKPLDRIKEDIKAHPKATLLLRIGGCFDGRKLGTTEAWLVAAIKELIKGKQIEPHYEFRDVQKIVEDDLFKSFMRKLQQCGCPADQIRELRDITIRAFMEAGICG
jgi:DNA repair exonuclease SbcCD nuclease subunit